MLNKFVVSPMNQKIDLKPGKTYKGSVLVANPADATETFYFRAEIHPYTVSGENYTQDFTTYSDWSKITDWITLDVTSGELAPNETKAINFTIDVPESAPIGGQYAVIGISSDGKEESNDSGVIQNVYEMASVIYANVEGEAKHDGQVLESQIPGFVAVGKPTITTKVTNGGNVHESLYTNISVKNMITGETVFPTDDAESTYESIIMPGTTRLVSHELQRIPALGIFEVKQESFYLDGSSEISGIMVICPVWFIVLVAATIASIITMFCYGRHLKKKSTEKPENSSEK